MKSFFISILLLVSLQVNAAPIKTVWNINNISQFDYPSLTYVTPSVPTSFNVTVVFPAEVTNVIDYGQTTITSLGELGETEFQSPLTSYVGTDPFASGLEDQVAYAFPNVSDYATTFFEEFAAQSNAYSASGELFWSYHIEIRVRRYTDSRGGEGTADYGFSTASTLEFLDDVMVNSSQYQFIFNESWQVFDGSTNEYFAGASWSSYNENISLLSVTTEVPEPASIGLIGLCLFGLSFVRKRIV